MVPLVLTMVQVVTSVSVLLVTREPAAKMKQMSVSQTPARMGDPVMWVCNFLIIYYCDVAIILSADCCMLNNHKQSVSNCSVHSQCLDHQHDHWSHLYTWLCVHICVQDVVNGYQCNCSVGWTGTNCDVNINDCTPTSCLNGGICYVSFICTTFTTPTVFAALKKTTLY